MSNYTSIKINTASATTGTKVGVKIPSTLGFLNKNELYTIQFKYIHIAGSNTWNVKVGSQDLGQVVTNQYEDINIDKNVTAKLCYITFTANEEMIKPSIEISRTRTSSDASNSDICEITDISLSKGGLNAYSPNVGDFLYLKTYLHSTIKTLAEGLLFSASKKDVDKLNNKINEALGQISVEAGKITLNISELDEMTKTINSVQQELTSTSIINKVNTAISGGSSIETTSTILNKNGFTVKNGCIYIKNKKDETVFTGDTNGNINMKGSVETINNYGRLYMNGNRLNGYKNATSTIPCYSAGVWLPPGASEYTGFVSVSSGNSLVSNDDAGCLYMSGGFSGSRKAMLQYSRYEGYHVGTVEFSAIGEVSLIARSKSYTDNQYGLWVTPEGYLFPYRGDEWIGKDAKRWARIYTSNLYSTNGVISGSDIKLKDNIRYLLRDAKAMSFNLDNNEYNDEITIEDTYNFVRDELKLATFNYKNSNSREKDNAETLGFIAQDLLFANSKIGGLLISESETGILNFNMITYISAISGALQKAIEKIEILEDRIKELENK